MSLKKLISAIVFATLATSSASQAAISPSIDLGFVSNGQFGSFVMTGREGEFQTFVNAYLPNNLKIDFTYSVNNGSIDYSYTDGIYLYSNTHTYNGSSFADTFPTNLHDDFVDFVPSSTQLTFSTANLVSPTDANGSFLNLSGDTASVGSYVHGILAAIGNRTLTVSYIVSSVPLPAMAPLFGAALAGLGFAARRKAKAAA